MRYFSFASRCRIFEQFSSGKRFVSYKTRKDLALTLNNMMSEFEVHDTLGLRSASQKGSQNCSSFAVSVLANGASGANSISIQSDIYTYLFNCGEGMQRLAMEHGQKLVKTRTVFITYHSWSNIGGIMGLCLSLRSQGVKEILIYGPPVIKEMVLGLRLFVTLKNISLVIVTDKPKLKYDDSLFKVQFVPIYPDLSKNILKTTSDINLSSDSTEDSESDSGSPSPKRRCHSEAREETTVNEFYSLCYICESPEFGVHLDVQKCNEFGVPNGPLLGVLKRKNDVKLPNGKTVYWKDVLTRNGKTETFIVVDCPTEGHLESFVNEPEFARFQGTPKKPAGLVIHITEPEIMMTPKYRDWMARFPTTTKHMKVNSSNRVIDHVDAYRLQEKLNFLDPVIFPKLSEDNLPEVKDELTGKFSRNIRVSVNCNDERQPVDAWGRTNGSLINSEELLKPGFEEVENINGLNVISAFSTLQWSIFPECKDKLSHKLFLDRKCCLNEVFDIGNIQEEIKELRELKARWEASSECQALPEYPKILFLGTGSSVPFSFRNTSAILVELEEGHLVLLDCGEGTYGQMLRFFGRERIREILKKLRLIYVSHQHADHHLGLINLLDARYKVLSRGNREDYFPESEPQDIAHLVMLLPPSVRDWVHSSNKFKTLLYDARIIVSTTAVKSFNTLKRYTNNLGITNFKSVQVPHSYESYGVRFVTSNGYKITYSGDTMPSDNLVELGKESDLLIHEATFEDGLETMAKYKKHCTIGQALDIGKRMQAKFVMLTHFSQRYSHLPQLNAELPENSGIAFDNMLVTPKILPFLTRLVKFYKMIFADKVVQLNSRTVKRLLKDEKKDLQHSAEMKI